MEAELIALTVFGLVLGGGFAWVLYKRSIRKKLEISEDLDKKIRDLDIEIYEVIRADIYNDKRHFELLTLRIELQMQKRDLFL